MASFTVIKKIGSGQVYTTLATWEADAPVDYTTANQYSIGTITGTFTQGETVTFNNSHGTGKFLDALSGSYIRVSDFSGTPASGDTVTGNSSGAVATLSSGATFTGCIWRGEINAASDVFSGSTNRLYISGGTVSATAYADLTAGAGASFIDNANVQTNPLRYDSTKGCAIECDVAGYTDTVDVLQAYTRLSRLQIAYTGAVATAALVIAGTGVRADDSIIESSGVAPLEASQGTYTNLLIVRRNGYSSRTVNNGANPNAYYNCTFVVPSDLTASTNCFYEAYYGRATTRNCVMLGCSAMSQHPTEDTHTTSYSNLSGITGVTQVTYAASMFGNGTTSITDATRDFRTRAGGALTAVVTADTTNAPRDIVGTLRPTGANASDAGCWQSAAAGGGGGVFIPIIGRGPGMALVGRGGLAG